MATPKKQTLSASAAALGLPTSALVIPKPTPKPVAKPKPTSSVVSSVTPKAVSGIGSTQVFPGDFGDGGVAGGAVIPEQPTWTKAGTVQTLNGPVDVDATGKAKNGSTPIGVTDPSRPSQPGAAYIWNGKEWVKPAKPAGSGDYSWDDNKGWSLITVVPGPTGGTTIAPEKMLASDTFRNTFALVFGKEEASKAYVGTLYKLVSGFYKTGSSVDDSINLAVRQARVDKTIPEFTKRFEGLFALDDMLAAGKLVDVPTVAEFIASENEAATLLREAGMPDLANSEFIGTQVLGKGKSVAEIGRILNNAFYAIDNAPAEAKKVLAENYPTATRSGLAAALIGGEKGAAQLQKEIAGYNIVAAARVQGVTTDLAKGMDLAAQGYNYSTALTGYGQVAAATGAYQKIKEMEGGTAIKTSEVQDALQKAILEKNFTEQEKLRLAAEREAARFASRAGNIGSKAFASQARGAGLV
jgi:hypothetical protein